MDGGHDVKDIIEILKLLPAAKIWGGRDGDG